MTEQDVQLIVFLGFVGVIIGLQGWRGVTKGEFSTIKTTKQGAEDAGMLFCVASLLIFVSIILLVFGAGLGVCTMVISVLLGIAAISVALNAQETPL